jgi:peptide/nickel transport system permease protein
VVEFYLPQDAHPEDFVRVREAWGLDKPIVVQYGVYVTNIMKGDWGRSFRYNDDALGLIVEKFPKTLKLAGFTIAISTVLGLGIGVFVSIRKGSIFDSGAKVLALLGQSVPSFWLGLMLMWIFAVHLGWLPTSGEGGIKHMIMPAIALGGFNVAALMRLTRSAMLDVLDSEYIKLARIKGLSERKIIWKHALRNAAIAPLTYFGVVTGFLLTGSVVTETVFAWPGIGLLAVEAVEARDYAVVQGVVIFMASMFIFANLVVDVLYAYLDPRIRYN